MASDVRGEAAPVGRVVGEMMAGRVSAEADANRRMLAAWLMSNGDRERVHTVGVWLKEPPREGALPTLVVYVDSSACVVDFRAQRELYLARLEAAGVRLAAIDVRLSKYAAQHRARRQEREQGRREPREPEAAELPPLSEAEERRVLDLIANLPDNLQKSAYRAISTSLRRDKAEESKKR